MKLNGVTDGTRTRDNRNHNPGLYQLSYSHHYYFSLLALKSKKVAAGNYAISHTLQS